MLKTIILNEIKQNILSLKLQVTFIIMMVVFLVGSIAYVIQYRNSLDDYYDYMSKRQDEIKKEADTNISNVATEYRDYLFAPLLNGFIDDAKSQFIPNNIKYPYSNTFTDNYMKILHFSLYVGDGANTWQTTWQKHCEMKVLSANRHIIIKQVKKTI